MLTEYDRRAIEATIDLSKCAVKPRSFIAWDIRRVRKIYINNWRQTITFLLVLLYSIIKKLQKVLYRYIEEKYKKFINSSELIFNEINILADFMNANVSFKFNYLVNLDNVKKVEYIMYSLFLNLDL